MAAPNDERMDCLFDSILQDCKSEIESFECTHICGIGESDHCQHIHSWDSASPVAACVLGEMDFQARPCSGVEQNGVMCTHTHKTVLEDEKVRARTHTNTHARTHACARTRTPTYPPTHPPTRACISHVRKARARARTNKETGIV